MSAPPPSQQAKPKGSRWGSVFTGAIAGLESRLDTILAEDDQASARSRAAERQRKLEKERHAAEGAEKGDNLIGWEEDELRREEATAEVPPGQIPVPPRERSTRDSLTSAAVTHTPSTSRSRTNDRLAERLARVVGSEARSKSKPNSISSTPAAEPSPLATDAPTPGESRHSLDKGPSEAPSEAGLAPIPLAETATAYTERPEAESEAKDENSDDQQVQKSRPVDPMTVEVTIADADIPPSSTVPARTSQESDRSALAAAENRPLTPALQDPALAALRAEHASELHSHLERIDALEAKLGYLTTAAAESARAAAADAEPGSHARALADRDERIAQLLDEGQRLSRGELVQLSAIKKLRARVLDDEKMNRDLRARAQRAEKGSHDAVERARRAEAAERTLAERLRTLARLEREVDAFRTERAEREMREQDLRRQVREAERRADEAGRKVQAEAGEREKAAVKQLREEMEDIKIGKKLAEDRARAEAQSVREDAARDKERAKTAELELRSEITSLETKLEVFRSRTEEAASGGGAGDSHAKLLRQIETLQTQYALASENWQGIEGALTARVAALERERDDLARREADVRRRARELTGKTRQLEGDVEGWRERASAHEAEAEERGDEAQKLRGRLAQAEAAAAEAVADLQRERTTWEAETRRKIEEERVKWRLENGGGSTTLLPLPDTPNLGGTAGGGFLRPHSPSGSARHRKPSGDPQGLGLQTRRSLSRNPSAELSPPPLDLHQLHHHHHHRSGSSRRSSMLRGTPPIGTPHREDSTASLPQLNGGAALPTPSIHPFDAADDAYDAASSPHRTINDVLSLSAAQAGPSVQVVERMSAAVRRLEAEKAGAREERARLAGQRDEARDEVVALMRELDDKAPLEARAARLEKDLKAMDERYQTTLEMLGEKSERVDELRNDVEDLKKIIREMVESTVQ